MAPSKRVNGARQAVPGKPVKVAVAPTSCSLVPEQPGKKTPQPQPQVIPDVLACMGCNDVGATAETSGSPSWVLPDGTRCSLVSSEQALSDALVVLRDSGTVAVGCKGNDVGR